MNETQQQIRSSTQPSKALIQPLMNLLYGLRRGIGQMRFHIAMTILFGIEVWRVLRQRLDNDLAMLKQEAQGLCTGVNMGMVADQDKPTRMIVQEVLPAPDHVMAVHGSCEMPLIDVPRQGQPDRHGYTPPFLGHPP